LNADKREFKWPAMKFSLNLYIINENNRDRGKAKIAIQR